MVTVTVTVTVTGYLFWQRILKENGGRKLVVKRPRAIIKRNMEK
jgi:hypothetical protein